MLIQKSDSLKPRVFRNKQHNTKSSQLQFLNTLQCASSVGNPQALTNHQYNGGQQPQLARYRHITHSFSYFYNGKTHKIQTQVRNTENKISHITLKCCMIGGSRRALRYCYETLGGSFRVIQTSARAYLQRVTQFVFAVILRRGHCSLQKSMYQINGIIT